MPELSVAAALNLGLLADSSPQLGSLIAEMRETPHKIVCSALTKAYQVPLRDDVDIWILRIEECCDDTESIIEWLNDNDIPMVVEDVNGGARHNAQWLESKIYDCMAAYAPVKQNKPAADFLWVLAASTGGPEALVKFLRALDEQRVKRCAFIVAQHIDSHAIPSLLEALRQNTGLSVRLCQAGDNFEAGCIYVVSPQDEFSLSESRRIVLTGEAWKGPYQPSINQVIAKVARCFRERAGAIVFTGMGDDGAEAVSMLSAVGGLVAVQSLESCTVDSMPRSVQAVGQVNYRGDVPALAKYVGLKAYAAG